MKKAWSCCIHSFLKIICEKNLCNHWLDPLIPLRLILSHLFWSEHRAVWGPILKWVSCSPELMTAGASPQTELITIVHVACLSYFLHVASSFVTFQPTWFQPFLMLFSIALSTLLSSVSFRSLFNFLICYVSFAILSPMFSVFPCLYFHMCILFSISFSTKMFRW